MVSIKTIKAGNSQTSHSIQIGESQSGEYEALQFDARYFHIKQAVMLKTGIIIIAMSATVIQKRSSMDRAIGPDGSRSERLLRLQLSRPMIRTNGSAIRQHPPNKLIDL